jgi:DNA-directed RNA polymerase specialized sigma24 family protein
MLLPVRVACRTLPSPEAIHSEALAYFMGCVARESLLGCEDARDLAADVVAAVLPRLGQLKAPLRYVMTMCRHRLIQFLRRKRAQTHWLVRDGRLSTDVDAFVCADTGLSDEWCLGDLELRQLALIRSCLEDADTLTRQVMRLRCETDLTFSEIAALVNYRPATLRMRVTRFAHRVRTAWEAHGHQWP